MNLSDIFDEVSVQMQADLEKSRKALSHSGLKGASNEQVVKDFLHQYMPGDMEVSTGIVVDSNGKKSRQLDIVIHSTSTPVFFKKADIRVIPIECVYAVIEVKAHLDKAELKKAFDNMQSVKELEKKAFFPSRSDLTRKFTLYGQEWGDWPIQHFVFAFESTGLESLLLNLNKLQGFSATHKRIDSICILDKGVIFNQTPDGMFSSIPEPTSRNVASETCKPLLLFYSMMSMIVNQAKMKPFNIHPYLGDMRF